MMFMSMASPLTGAPGAVSLYGLMAFIAWPNGRPGGLLGIKGTKIAWAILWVLMAWLWLEAPSSNPNAITDAINAAPSGMSWLSTVQNWAANAASGIGTPIALLACALSLTIGIGVLVNWHARTLLKVAIVLSLVYWVLGQGFGGIVQGGATDPNSGPLFVLLACVLYALLNEETASTGERRRRLQVASRSSRGGAMSALRRSRRPSRQLRAVLLLGCSAALLTGCAAADKNAATTPAKPKSSSTTMVGMNMGSGTTPGQTVAPLVKGIKPVPTQVLASTKWQGMAISAEAMTAVPFLVFNGTKETEIKPSPKTSFHLMVMLNDAQTHVPIPYASVWATISKGSKLVYDERLWPMISRYMGPHYGNNVSLPGAGEYKLSLLVSPPESARHVEYQNVWLKPHRANFAFHWKAAT